MRHLLSLLAGIVAAPLTWLFLATGQDRSQATVAAWNDARAFDTVDLIGPAIFLVAAGVVLGLLGTLRWSPVGPLAAGVLLVVPTIFMFIHPFNTLDVVSERWHLLGQDMAPRLPVENGTLLVLGVLLLMAVFSAERWRGAPAAAGATGAAGTAAAEPAAGTAGDEGTGDEAEARDETSPEAGESDPEATEPEPAAEPEPDAYESKAADRSEDTDKP